MIIAKGDDRERNGPGENEKDEHEDSGTSGSVKVVEAAAGQESFWNVFAETDIECWNYGEDGTVDPDNDNHQSGTNTSDRSERIQRINNDKISIDGYGSQCGNRCDSSESTKETV